MNKETDTAAIILYSLKKITRRINPRPPPSTFQSYLQFIISFIKQRDVITQWTCLHQQHEIVGFEYISLMLSLLLSAYSLMQHQNKEHAVHCSNYNNLVLIKCAYSYTEVQNCLLSLSNFPESCYCS